MLPSATTVKVADTWPENAPKNPEKEKTEVDKTTENATTARRSVTSQETALKAETEGTERKQLNATSVTKVDISPEIARVILKIYLD